METATAIITTISLSGILLLLGRFRGCAVDSFRQEIFALRDELFDRAASGAAISFDHPAYGMLRSTMNGFVRWADQLQLLQVMLMLIASRRDDWRVRDRDFDSQWNHALADLQPDDREWLISCRERMHRLLASYLVLRSPVVVATLVIPLITWLFSVAVGNRILALLIRVISPMDAQALEFGSAEDSMSSLPGRAASSTA